MPLVCCRAGTLLLLLQSQYATCVPSCWLTPAPVYLDTVCDGSCTMETRLRADRDSELKGAHLLSDLFGSPTLDPGTKYFKCALQTLHATIPRRLLFSSSILKCHLEYQLGFMLCLGSEGMGMWYKKTQRIRDNRGVKQAAATFPIPAMDHPHSGPPD